MTTKLLYCGPGMSGRSTSLNHLASHHESLRKVSRGGFEVWVGKVEHRGRRLDVEAFVSRARSHRDIDLFNTNALSASERVEAEYFRALDGIVFVVESQSLSMNIWIMENLESDLRKMGRNLKSTPLVFQLNKRDVPKALPTSVFRSALCWPGAPIIESVATNGVGTWEAFRALLDLV